MKTEGSSQRRLVGALIILLAVAGAWAVLNRQSRKATREEQSLAYQQMPALKACGAHLTDDDEHMLSHGFVGIPFERLDKRGREALLELAREQTREILADREISDEEKQKSIDAVLEAMPESVVGFQKEAPGSAYIFLDPRDLRQHVPLHVVPEAKHGPWRGYNIFEHHGAEAHALPPEEHERTAPETGSEDAESE